MAEAPLTLGTAGHIDHGKTALIRALTGRDTDRLPEEHARGISIELGYARMELPSGRTLSVVDVPGHERFVRTMVAGATGIDLFLLCIAADDGVMPQTREHLAVLRQLGVARGVIAVTKSDVADPGPAIAEAAELLPGIEAVAVAAPRGEGLDELRAVLDRVAVSTRSRAYDLDAPTRLHVDRSFSLKGIGTVVTGTLWSGSIEVPDQVEVLPGRIEARVRSVQVHDQAVERAWAGQRVALNLAGVRRQEVSRGDVVVKGVQVEPAYIVDARIEFEADAHVDPGTRLHVHHGTRESPARVYPLGGGYAQLRLESPIVALRGDRIVLRQIAPPDTIGGGTVIEAPARRHGSRPEVVDRLRALEAGAPAVPVEATVDERPARPRKVVSVTLEPYTPAAVALRDLLRADGERPRTDNELAAAAGLESAEVAAAFRPLEVGGDAVRVDRNLHFEANVLKRLVRQVVELCERDGAATIASVRDELGTSRKYAQAILEYMDAQKLTLRRDDEHVLRRRQGSAHA